MFNNTSCPRILIITLRYLGDTLLVTPLINSLKRAYPAAQIDVLVFENTAAMLAENPAVSRVITVAQKPTRQQQRVLFKQIFRRYDLAVCTQTGDRPTLYSFLAASLRIGFVPQRQQTGWLKRYLFTRWLEFDTEKTHTVLELLKLCRLLEIEPIYKLTAPQSEPLNFQSLTGLTDNYAVLHLMPQWRYKQWTAQGWIALAHYLKKQGLQVVLSGSHQPQEVAFLADIATQCPADTLSLAGKLSLAELAQLLKQARLFVGVDTGISHLASAAGVTTVVLFGPSDPVKWTPWPYNYHTDKPPFSTHGNQHVNNVYLIQGQKECVPCYLEGCERHQQSYSACLDELKAETVIEILSTVFADKN